MGAKRHLLYLAVVAAAIGGPIFMFSSHKIMANVRKGLFGGSTTADPTPAAPLALVESPEAPTAAIGANPTAPPTFPQPSLEEVLRFDVSVEWVMQRWPRVTTGLSQLQWQGYRVPLVTGTKLHDVAGALTYYFNARQQVQRITLRGTTGDPGLLVTLLTSRHSFVRRLTNDPGLVILESVDSSNQPAGKLVIRSAGVIQADRPYTRFEFDLTMDRTE
jgi:hypothetical protein